METSASFEARSAPPSYSTAGAVGQPASYGDTRGAPQARISFGCGGAALSFLAPFLWLFPFAVWTWRGPIDRMSYIELLEGIVNFRDETNS